MKYVSRIRGSRIKKKIDFATPVNTTSVLSLKEAKKGKYLLGVKIKRLDKVQHFMQVAGRSPSLHASGWTKPDTS